MNQGLKFAKGLAQIPLLIGLLIMAVAVPVATNLVQQNQENRGKAYEGQVCESDAECGSGFWCTNGYCHAATPTNGVYPTSVPTQACVPHETTNCTSCSASCGQSGTYSCSNGCGGWITHSCSGPTCKPNATAVPTSSCGKEGQTCCAGSSCGSGLTCTSAGYCNKIAECKDASGNVKPVGTIQCVGGSDYNICLATGWEGKQCQGGQVCPVGGDQCKNPEVTIQPTAIPTLVQASQYAPSQVGNVDGTVCDAIFVKASDSCTKCLSGNSYWLGFTKYCGTMGGDSSVCDPIYVKAANSCTKCASGTTYTLDVTTYCGSVGGDGSICDPTFIKASNACVKCKSGSYYTSASGLTFYCGRDPNVTVNPVATPTQTVQEKTCDQNGETCCWDAQGEINYCSNGLYCLTESNKLVCSTVAPTAYPTIPVGNRYTCITSTGQCVQSVNGFFNGVSNCEQYCTPPANPTAGPAPTNYPYCSITQNWTCRNINQTCIPDNNGGHCGTTGCGVDGDNCSNNYGCCYGYKCSATGGVCVTDYVVPTPGVCGVDGDKCSTSAGCCAGYKCSTTGACVTDYNYNPGTTPVPTWIYNPNPTSPPGTNPTNPPGSNPTNPPGNNSCSGSKPADVCTSTANLKINAQCVNGNWDYDENLCNQAGRKVTCGGTDYCCPSAGGSFTTNMSACSTTSSCTRNKGTATLNDYNNWRSELVEGGFGKVSKTTWQTDYNCDNRINLLDFSIWREAYVKLNGGN